MRNSWIVCFLRNSRSKALRVLALWGLLCCVTVPKAHAFAPRTMRLDYLHTGTSDRETFSRERVVLEPLPWPGNPEKPLDDSNLGDYSLEVRDLRSGRPLYSRGYSSLFSEWQTTDEAQRNSRTFSESLRFPAPSVPVQISVQKRDRSNRFEEIWSTTINPRDPTIQQVTTLAPVIDIEIHGPPADRVDLLFLGEGYTAGELWKCSHDVRQATEALFRYSPFRERRESFNLRAICAASPESGVSHPSRGLYRRTLFDSKFDVFGTARYALSFNNRAIREVAANAPYEFLAIVMNDRAYGAGGIFGQFATVSIDNPHSLPAFVHEFGHHFAALADEYFLSPVAYAPVSPIAEPWEPNVTALLDPPNLKWKDLISTGTPVPTPWPEKEYIRTNGSDRYLLSGPYAGKVGAFEGARYMRKGYYRSEQICLMITLTCNRFCAACRKAVNKVIDLYAPLKAH